MNTKAVCFLVMVCVAVISAIPVVELIPQDGNQEPLERVVVVKRSAQFDRGAGGIPCRGYSAYRCPHQDVPALCRSFDLFSCHDTDFINVNIGP